VGWAGLDRTRTPASTLETSRAHTIRHDTRAASSAISRYQSVLRPPSALAHAPLDDAPRGPANGTEVELAVEYRHIYMPEVHALPPCDEPSTVRTPPSHARDAFGRPKRDFSPDSANIAIARCTVVVSACRVSTTRRESV
jgi:hypothetical protein